MNADQTTVRLGTPTSEFKIDASLVHKLLADQYPDLVHLPIRPVDAGWDNVMFRLGDHLCVRLPRRKIAAPLIEHEQSWLPMLASQLPIAVPVPLKVGMPSHGYPWRWSILPWLSGQTADDQPILDDSQAQRFGSFLKALHQPAPFNAPHNPVRGVPLFHRAESIEERIQRLAAKTDCITDNLRQIWQAALQAPAEFHPRWLHGDLHPRNVLVNNGIITGIIDWGDITAGDVATDLASLWMLFADHKVRLQALAAYGEISETVLARAKGWAILLGVVLLDTGLIDHSRHRALGKRILAQVSQAV